MTSKKLFFKLIIQDLKKRIWCPLIIFISYFLAFEVMLLMQLDNIKQFPGRYDYDARTYVSEYFFGTNAQIYMIIVCITALVCAVSGFAYLHSKTQLDTYHSLPVSRTQLFLSKYISGILQFLIPFVIHVVICLAMAAGKDAWNDRTFTSAMSLIGIELVIFLLSYSTSIVAVFLTGNIIISILGSVVLFSYSTIVACFLQWMFERFLHSFVSIGSSINNLLFEGVWSFSPLSMIIKLFTNSAPDSIERILANDFKYNVSYIPVMVFGAAVYSVLAFILYQKRASEAAGKTIAFSWAEPVIKTMCVIPAAFYSGMFFTEIAPSDDSRKWFVFGMIFGYVILALVLEIIFRMDIKGVFQHKKQFLFNAACTLLIFVIFRYDVLGYNTYVPADQQLQSCAVSIADLMPVSQEYRLPNGSYYYVDNISYRMEHMEIQGNPSVMELARKAAKENFDGENYYYDDDDSATEKYRRIIFGYKLLNGKTIYREYWVNILDEETKKLLADVFEDYDYKLGSTPTLNESWNINYDVVYCENSFKSGSIELTPQLQAKLLETYQSEYTKLSLDTVMDTYPLGDFRLAQKEENYRYFSADGQGLLIYPQFTATIALLAENGFDFNETVTAEDVDKIMVTYYDVKEEIPNGKYISYYSSQCYECPDITDQAQIQEILENTINTNWSWQTGSYTDFFEDEKNGRFELTFRFKDESLSSCYYRFIKGKTPDFMGEDYIEQGKEQSESNYNFYNF